MKEKIKFIQLFMDERTDLLTHPQREIDNLISKISQIIDLRVTIVDHSGVVIADSDVDDVSVLGNHKYRIEIKNSISSGIGESIRYSSTLKIDMLYIALNYEYFVIRLSKPLYEIEESLSKLQRMIIIFSLFIIAIAAIIIAFISGKITRPIEETIDFSEHFSKGDYSRRILNYADDEIGTLQKSLNRVADIVVSEMNNLILEQNKLKITIESINDGIAVIDNNKRIILCNYAFISILDIGMNAIGKVYFEVIRGSELNIKIEHSLNIGEQIHFEETLYNGKICDVLIKPIKEEKTIQGILVVLYDVTEKKKMDQLKTDLVGNLSHELKTPIAIIRGYLETIKDHLHDPTQCREFIEKAMLNIDRQNSIINDMIKLNMLETMQSIQLEKINIQEIILNCIEILSSKAGSKDITITNSIDILNQNITGNRFLIEEIFFNLIDNAINYNNRNGKIHIDAERFDKQKIITISDTGIGIPEDSIDRIFERFYRVDKSRSRSSGGTGLGLSIVKHAISLLNWEVSVSSNAHGTKFILKI
ncbi:MAG: ATP-binding protein [Spirochaetota bacterium]|nr:ATP-binding protein [Spirochaetota bacterium]